MKRVEIIVSPQGESKVETHGFNGSSCIKASQFIELALGKATGSLKTAAYYVPIDNENQLRQSNDA